jgi:peptidoglycan hydrolase CwlO-like protein
MNFINLIAAENSPPGVVTLDVSWASDVLALIGILGAVATVIALWIRLEVKKNFNEIKAEFKPNGGSSLKDQVNRLEKGHENLEDRFNNIDKKVDSLDSKVDTIVNFIIKTKDTE